MLGKWEVDRGDQNSDYDFWWHLAFDTLLTSEWGTPKMIEKGLQPEILMSGGYGHKHARLGSAPEEITCRTLDLGKEHQMVLECVRRTIRRRHMALSAWSCRSTISRRPSGCGIGQRRMGNQESDRDPRRTCRPGTLPPALKDFKAVPPLVTDIELSLDDRFLYVSCWGTGEFRQYDVSDPLQPKPPAQSTLAESLGGPLIPRIRSAVARRAADGRGQP